MKERKRGATRKTYAPPNWDEWESRKTGKLYQANALAWDIDPNLIRPENPGASGPFRYQISLGEAVIALMEGQISGWDKPDLDVPPEHAVGPLADFARWAEAPPRERKLPKRFPGRGTTTGREVVATEDPAQAEPTRPQYSGETSKELSLKESKRANWLRKGRLPLWQAVALSFGVDPDVLQFPQRDFHRISFVNGRGEGLDDFRLRLEEAESHLGDALPVAEEVKSEIAGVAHRCASTVRLAEFGAWLRVIGIEAPAWFPDPVTAGYARGTLTDPLQAIVADWSYWRLIGSCPLWQAVLLTLDLEPRAFSASVGMFRSIRLKPGYDAVSKETVRMAMDRLAIAQSNVSVFGALGEEDGWGAAIDLRSFGAWAAVTWPSIPELFPGRPKLPAEEKETSGDLSSRGRRPYENLIAALADKAGYSLAEPFKDAESIIAHAKTIGVDLGRSKTGEILTAARARRENK